MTVTIPPPEIEDERSVEERIAELEALIKEARRRARRRRAAYAVVVLVALAGVVGGVVGIGGGGVDIDASVAAQGSPASATNATNTSRAGLPTCSPANVQSPGALVHGGGYLRYCGSGKAVVRVGGKVFTIKGGRCTSRRVGFGVLEWGIGGTLAARASRARGFTLVVQRANRPGRQDIIQRDIQLPGLSFAKIPDLDTGTVIKAEDLGSATFSIGKPGDPARITGSWICGLRI